MQQRRNDQVRARFNNRNPRIDQSGQTNQTVNNRRIERLINRDRGTSRPDLERNNRLNQQRPIVNQQNQLRTQANLVNTREANSPVQNRQINQLRPPRNNLVRPDNNSFRQQPAAAERNRQSNQGQITQQRPARNNLERPANVNSQQQPAAAERNRQSSQGQITQQRPARNNQERSAIVNSPRQPAATRNISQGNQRSESIAQRRESAGKMNTRSGNHMSLRHGGISQKSAGGLGLNAE
jgi:hypothetical protein